MTKPSKSNRHKCEHCRRQFYAFDDDTNDLCPKCRQRLDQAKTEQPMTQLSSPGPGGSELTRPWQMTLFREYQRGIKPGRAISSCPGSSRIATDSTGANRRGSIYNHGPPERGAGDHPGIGGTCNHPSPGCPRGTTSAGRNGNESSAVCPGHSHHRGS